MRYIHRAFHQGPEPANVKLCSPVGTVSSFSLYLSVSGPIYRRTLSSGRNGWSQYHSSNHSIFLDQDRQARKADAVSFPASRSSAASTSVARGGGGGGQLPAPPIMLFRSFVGTFGNLSVHVSRTCYLYRQSI